MEENRLKPMKPGYDKALFLKIYAETKGLRKKLTSEIDCNRLGLDAKEIMSSFDVKFIYSFNKYYGEVNDPEVLKAHIIRSLQFFKLRILRLLYSQKNQVNDNCLSLEDLQLMGKEPSLEASYDSDTLQRAMNYLQMKLSPEAFQVLNVDLSPPLYILKRLENTRTEKIPNTLVEEYLGLESGSVINLRKEIKATVSTARYHFRA